MFEMRTNRKFRLSRPIGRESHQIAIARALMKVFRGETKRLIINIPPRYAKTEFLIHFVAYSLAIYPDCNFLYTSYAQSLAAKQTAIIRDIISSRFFNDLFHVKLNPQIRSKSDFETIAGGSVYAAGIGGQVVGRGGGIKYCTRFGGALLIDDAHKPSEAPSDVQRQAAIDWYESSMQGRRNDGPKTPMICIGQRVHEADLCNYLAQKKYEKWDVLSIPALDNQKHALDPETHTAEWLLNEQDTNPYIFAAQYQQNPQPAGGCLWKREWFLCLFNEPKIIGAFMTVDTAETDKSYNDATVFSLFGIYKVAHHGNEIENMYALHWLDCWELRVEPNELEDCLIQFYTDALGRKIPIWGIAIEKKSTGVTLFSIIKNIQGLKIIEINRTKVSGSKTTRYIEVQPILTRKLVTLPANAKHTEMCIKHCEKITANDSHRYDDIADTLYDGIKIGLIDMTIINLFIKSQQSNQEAIAAKVSSANQKIKQLKEARSWRL
jgi:predicted phage terminase large subunit-like protein